ncbi:mitochondrial inner membrane protease subunit [Paraphaeosphaeria minitans]|uniref:Mitochondrial inner membrane protease subunit n=1 Tax=Paraphaeosphaeria minitans TaxID=565426 RepID=A0A9P6GRI9_9PLEO|nr:mitochondrial inner membrane protease subunit [Paraphaeosphaeria minitans]
MPPPRIRPSSLFFSAQSPRLHTAFFHQHLHPQRVRTQTLTTFLARLRHQLQPSSDFTPALTTFRIAKTTAKLFLAIHLVFTYIGVIGPTNGISMVPTIPHSYRYTPYIMVSHLHRRGRNIAVGDVVTFDTPGPSSTRSCKRVVGMPGDFVAVLSTGRGQDDLGKQDDEGDWANVRDEIIRVPEGHVWLAGDNLDWSRDSRVFGPVPLNVLKGKVVAVVWPLNDAKWLGGEEAIADVKEGGHEPVVTR